MKTTDKVLVVGATGYTGAWLIDTLSGLGFTNITGTYRSEEKADYMKKKYPDVTFIKADLLTDDNWAEATKDAKWIFNNSATFDPNDQTTEEISQTKVNAVERLYQFANEAGTVEKIVQLGSEGGVSYGNTDPNKTVFNEDDWTDPTTPGLADIFMIIKPYEEKAADDFIANDDKNDSGMKLTVLHPTSIIGPSVTPWQHDMIYAYLANDGFIAESQMYSVDVRDLANMEITLMNDPNTSGKRYLGSGMKLMLSQLESMVREHYSDDELQTVFGSVVQVVPGEEAAAILAPVSDTQYYRDFVPRMLDKVRLETKYPDVYHYQYTDPQTTVYEAVDKMLADTLNKMK